MTPSTRSLSATLLLLCLVVTLPLSATLTQVAERRMNTDSNEEFEPTAVSYVSSSVEYNAVVYMRFPSTVAADPNSTFQVRSWNSSGGTATSAIPTHASYTRYADPVLVKDDSTTTVYLVGLGVGAGGRAILVWVSTNHGVSWSAPTVFATSNGMDKPVATTMTGSRIWIAYIESTGLRAITATYSGSTWTVGSPITIDNSTLTGTTTTGQNPQIMVDSNGDIYIFYMNNSDQFGLMRAAAGTTTFSRVTTTSVGTLYAAEDTTQWLAVKTNSPQVHVRGITIPVAKLDRSRRRISIAWHETSGSGSRIRFIAYRTDLGSWSAATTVADGGGHEINPGMDFNPADGYYVVTWYQFSSALTHAQYHQRGSHITFDGSGDPVAESPSTVRSRPGDAANLSQTPVPRTYVGDYHDVVFSNGTWKAIHLVAPQRNWDGTLTETSDHWAFTVSH
jgi:hypothetical protein